ncbi:MAG TPA: hypothetical protein VFL97_05135 [Nitrococcus sp.]|nr:hypothetical protein [Nitrococcus sp.]
MPGQADTSLPNCHKLYVATSGGGKSSALKADLAASKPERLVMWDPEGEHETGVQVGSIAQFTRVLAGATCSGKRYSIAVQVRPSVDEFERFCRAVWAVACSTRPMTVVVEELADVTRNAGKASPAWGELIRRGRKYGVTIYVVTQSPTEISKTVYRNVNALWCGVCETEAERRRMAAHLDIGLEKMRALQPLEYYQKRLGHPASRGKITFSRGLPRL